MRTRRWPARGGFSRICRRRSTPCRRRRRATTTRARRGEADEGIPRNRRKVYKMRPIIRAVVDEVRSSRLAASSAAQSSAGWRGSTGAPCCCSPATRISMAAGGPPTLARRSRGSSTSRRPSTCPSHLADFPGFIIGSDAERAATIRHGARAIAAVYQATIPWCTVMVRRAFDVAGAAHQPSGGYTTVRLAFGQLGLPAARGRN